MRPSKCGNYAWTLRNCIRHGLHWRNINWIHIISIAFQSWRTNFRIYWTRYKSLPLRWFSLSLLILIFIQVFKLKSCISRFVVVHWKLNDWKQLALWICFIKEFVRHIRKTAIRLVIQSIVFILWWYSN